MQDNLDVVVLAFTRPPVTPTLLSARHSTCTLVDTSFHFPDSLKIGERKFECVQRRRSSRSQFWTSYSRHHSARARIAPNTKPTVPDHSPHTPDAPWTARFELQSRRTAGCGLNPAPAGDSCLATQQQPSAPHKPALATQSPPDPSKPRIFTPPKDEASFGGFCDGGDTASDRDLHTHTQMAVRTRQDTVYSPWPQDKSETAGGVAILEHQAS